MDLTGQVLWAFIWFGLGYLAHALLLAHENRKRERERWHTANRRRITLSRLSVR